MTSNTFKILIEVIKQVFSFKIGYKNNFDTIELINNMQDLKSACL